jgi:ferredoxin
MAHYKRGYRFEDDWTEKQLRNLVETEGYKIARTIPVNIEIRAEQKVLSLEKAERYLDQTDEIILNDCTCRTFKNYCDKSKDTCISWGSTKEIMESEAYRHLSPKVITKVEALATLRRSHEAGLVHMAYAVNDDVVNTICSCCSCCCAVFSSVFRFGLFPHLLTSDTISVTDPYKCNNSGVCVDRCQFGAREIVGGNLVFHSDRCFGCGLCSSTCPSGAIKIIDKKQ